MIDFAKLKLKDHHMVYIYQCDRCGKQCEYSVALPAHGMMNRHTHSFDLLRPIKCYGLLELIAQRKEPR